MIIGMVQFFVRAAQALYKGLSEDFYRQVSSFCGSRLQIGKLLPLSHKQGTHKHNAFLRVHGLKMSQVASKAMAAGRRLRPVLVLLENPWWHLHSYNVSSGGTRIHTEPATQLSSQLQDFQQKSHAHDQIVVRFERDLHSKGGSTCGVRLP